MHLKMLWTIKFLYKYWVFDPSLSCPPQFLPVVSKKQSNRQSWNSRFLELNGFSDHSYIADSHISISCLQFYPLQTHWLLHISRVFLGLLKLLKARIHSFTSSNLPNFLHSLFWKHHPLLSHSLSSLPS